VGAFFVPPAPVNKLVTRKPAHVNGSLRHEASLPVLKFFDFFGELITVRGVFAYSTSSNGL
jgi:hypothetical protein